MNINIGFRYGIICDDLETQANEQGYTLGDKGELCEGLKRSLNMVCIHGLLTDSQADIAFKKLHKKVISYLKPKGE